MFLEVELLSYILSDWRTYGYNNYIHFYSFVIVFVGRYKKVFQLNEIILILSRIPHQSNLIVRQVEAKRFSNLGDGEFAGDQAKRAHGKRYGGKVARIRHFCHTCMIIKSGH